MPHPTTPPERRVFLVDDHRIMRQALRLFIDQEEGLIVCGEAGDAAEALTSIAKLQPDAVIADISLPGMNGIEFIKNLKAQMPEIAVVVLSMHHESVYAERALRAGASGYVMKKQTAEEVVLALRRALDGEYHVSSGVTGAIFHKALGKSPTGKAASGSPADVLSDRELEVFELLGRGKSTREIATLLHLSGKTVETHRAHIKEKCQLPTNADMIRHATLWVEHVGKE